MYMRRQQKINVCIKCYRTPERHVSNIQDVCALVNVFNLLDQKYMLFILGRTFITNKFDNMLNDGGRASYAAFSDPLPVWR